MKNTKQSKKSIVKTIVESPQIKDLSDIVELPQIKDPSDIIDWSYAAKRNKSQICEDSVQLLKKIGKTKPKDLVLITKMINLHNEYRFPVVQLMDTTQKNIDVSYEFLIFLSKTSK